MNEGLKRGLRTDISGAPISEFRPPRESHRVEVMCALDLILDVAYHDGNERDLAVAAEAYTLAGYHDESIMVSHASRDEVLGRVTAARRARPKRILRADARGLLYGLSVMCQEGLLDAFDTRGRQNDRWKARGGHDRRDVA